MRVLIGIPLYNEQAYLSECISLLFNFLNNECQEDEISVFLVDDGSTDQSQIIYEKLAEKFPFSFTRQGNGPLGYGKTILRLFQKAKNNYDTLITFDADLQHAPFSIKEILETLIKYPSVDLVSTSRYLSYRFWKQNTKAPMDRYITNMMVTKTINQCFNLNLTDVFCGLKGYRTIKLPKSIDETGYAFPLTFWHYVYQNKLIVYEIETPIIYRLDRRTRGEWKNRMKEYYMKLGSLVSPELKQLVNRDYQHGIDRMPEIMGHFINNPIQIYKDFIKSGWLD